MECAARALRGGSKVSLPERCPFNTLLASCRTSDKFTAGGCMMSDAVGWIYDHYMARERGDAGVVRESSLSR
jgi:hypothetical protein